MQIQSIREDLTAQCHIFAVKLKIQHTHERSLERLLAGGSQSNKDTGQAEQVLAEIDKQLMELEPGSGRPQDFLRKLENVLTAPGNFLTEETIGMRLNWMGVKLKEESAENGREITLSELEIPGRLKRVALLTKISVSESLSS